MTRRQLLLIYLAALLVSTAAAVFQSAPGYMDAEYYYAGALRIAAGQPNAEPYLWNYLNDPASLPAPSFSYWMPLPSALAALGLALARPLGFWAARIGFILAAASVAPLTAALCCRLTGSRRMALLAGLFAVFPGFYLPFLTVTDAFPLFMLLGGLFMLNVGGLARQRRLPVARFLGLGVLAGLLHMARADGLLWLGGAFFAALLWAKSRQGQARGFLHLALAGGLALSGYVLIAAPWYLHNLNQWGALMPPGGARAMWITQYEQTMIFPPHLLTPEWWLAAGWQAHWDARWHALIGNFQTAAAVQGSIVLFPFVLLGLWNLRRRAEAQVGAFMWLVTAAVMTLVFPFAGTNGGFFHSGAGVQPLLWAAAPLGMDRAVRWYASKRGFPPDSLLRFASLLAVAVCALLSALIYTQRVFGEDVRQPKWSASERHYQDVEAALRRLGAAEGDTVLVNNPPGYWLVSRRPAAVIPYGDEKTLVAAAERYGATYIILENRNPYPLSALYRGQSTPPELEYLLSVGQTKLYRVIAPEAQEESP